MALSWGVKRPTTKIELSVDLKLLRSRRVGKYGIKVKSSSSSPTARYADFMSVMEIVRMYPDRVPVETVIEVSDIA